MLLLFLLDGRRGRAPDEYLQRRRPGLHRFYALHLYEGSFRQDSLSLQSGNYPNAILMTIAFCAAFSPAAWAGYDLHITRAKEWTESKKTPVPVEGWVQYIKSDSEFRLVQPQDPKGKPRDAIWIDPKDKARVLFLLLGWRDSVKDPSRAHYCQDEEGCIEAERRRLLVMMERITSDDAVA